MDKLVWLAPAFAAVALFFAFIKTLKVSKADPGTDRMKEIAGNIADGAKAFLFAEYKILVIFVAVLFVLIGLFISWLTAVCFLVGAIFSVCAGYLGMHVATRANVRTANAARTGGMNKALSIAFSGGSVMGMCVVGLGLLGCSLIYLISDNVEILTGFSLGASSIALFARVGGGIYTKAADVGADLFESYVGAIVSALTLGIAVKGAFNGAGAIYPLVLAACGIFASVIATFFVRGKENSNPHTALKLGSYVSAILVACAAVGLGFLFFNSWKQSVAIVAGLVVGLLIGVITEIYTSGDYKSVKRIAQQSETGSATTVISGMAVGMRSTVIPILLIGVGIFISYKLCGLYGIALAAVGMLSTTGITVAVDAYGPIADNAGGIAEMSGLDHSVRKITDKLDAVGNTTAAMGKGFAIGSAALTALALFFSFSQAAGIKFDEISLSGGMSILNYRVTIGLLVGGMLPFVFSAMTMDSVSKAANKMIEEVRRQFRSIPGIMEGTGKPDYKSCVSISTTAALKEMLVPGVMAVLAPLAVGILLGVDALGGKLAGALVTGVLMAIFMSNAGGAWDNAKKYIEDGNNGGKGSEAHKAAVVGDTVGDPCKDTSGPSINILIKLMTVVSLVFAPIFLSIGGGNGLL